METNISEIRKEYTLQELDESQVEPDPLVQFRTWLQQAVTSELKEPTAFFLATVAAGQPSGRVVLLKEVDDQGMVFYTNYQSRKGTELAANAQVAATWWWDVLERQVRVEGQVQQIPPQQSEAYFQSRPRASQLGAWASPQSQPVPHRQYLDQLFAEAEKKFEGSTVALPPHWGGYRIIPHYFEFWQGRRSRLHDRVCYTLVDGGWQRSRLAP